MATSKEKSDTDPLPVFGCGIQTTAITPANTKLCVIIQEKPAVQEHIQLSGPMLKCSITLQVDLDIARVLQARFAMHVFGDSICMLSIDGMLSIQGATDKKSPVLFYNKYRASAARKTPLYITVNQLENKTVYLGYLIGMIRDISRSLRGSIAPGYRLSFVCARYYEKPVTST